MLGEKDRLITQLREENKYLRTLIDRLLEGRGLEPVDQISGPAAQAEGAIDAAEEAEDTPPATAPGGEIFGG